MAEFTQEEELFILEVKWAEIIEKTPLEGVWIGTAFSFTSFQSPLFKKEVQERLAYEIPISELISGSGGRIVGGTIAYPISRTIKLDPNSGVTVEEMAVVFEPAVPQKIEE